MTEETLDTWQKAVVFLKDRGVKKIRVTYEGSGDSGAIEDVDYYDKEDDEHYCIQLGITDSQHDDIQNLAYPMLDGIEDWYNNEGGYGSIYIDLDEFTYNIENNIRVTEVETYSHNGSLKEYLQE
jgi:hypothetical protein